VLGGGRTFNTLYALIKTLVYRSAGVNAVLGTMEKVETTVNGETRRLCFRGDKTGAVGSQATCLHSEMRKHCRIGMG
jgi:hypothetical protein